MKRNPERFIADFFSRNRGQRVEKEALLEENLAQWKIVRKKALPEENPAQGTIVKKKMLPDENPM